MAGVVWCILSENGTMTMAKLIKAIGEPRDNVMQALGWLAREDKIDIVEDGRSRVVSLRGVAHVSQGAGATGGDDGAVDGVGGVCSTGLGGDLLLSLRFALAFAAAAAICFFCSAVSRAEDLLVPLFS